MKNKATLFEIGDLVSWGRSVSLPTILPPLVAICCVLLFYVTNNFIERVDEQTDFILPISILALIGAIGFARVSYEMLPSVFTVLTRSTAIGILVYLIIEPPNFTLANETYSHLAAYVDWGYWVAVACAGLSAWRPSFLYPAAFYTISTRYAVVEISEFYLSDLDIRYMVEMGQFLAISACGLALMRLTIERRPTSHAARIFTQIDLRQFALCLAFIAIGFHLGNYLWSGVSKVFLGPYPWSWMLDNATNNIILVGLKKGVLPSGAIPWFTQLLFDVSGALNPLFNMFVLVTQLFALIAVLSVIWLRRVTYAYDALHIGVYIFGGLLFWPWIWNNVSVLLAIRHKTDQDIGWGPKLCCILTILFGFTNNLGGSARLAWWDIADIKTPMIQAQTEDNRWVDVPVSYFLAHSFSISQGVLINPATHGHYEPTVWGSTTRYYRQELTGTCPEAPKLDVVESPISRKKRWARAERFLLAHHRKMMGLVDENGFYNFYLRSHHHPSNYWMYAEFNSLNIRKIKRYRLVTQSVCMSMSEGQLVERVIKEDAVTFDVDG